MQVLLLVRPASAYHAAFRLDDNLWDVCFPDLFEALVDPRLLQVEVDRVCVKVLVGASGAIFAVMGTYFAFFPEARIRMLLWFFFFVQIVPVRAKWIIGAWVVQDFVLTLLAGGDATTRYHAARALGDEYGVTLWFEAFADRAYDNAGHLVSRQLPGAVHHDSATILDQALEDDAHGLGDLDIEIAADLRDRLADNLD